MARPSRGASPPEADQFPRLSQVGILEAQGPQCLTEENAPEVFELCLKCILWAASPREMVCIDLSQLSLRELEMQIGSMPPDLGNEEDRQPRREQVHLEIQGG